MCLKSIDKNDTVWLERLLSEEDANKAIHDLGLDRAPCPDCFPMKFYIIGWEFIREYLIKVFKEFHDNNIWDTYLKNNFIALIIKKIRMEKVKDFHTIGLIAYTKQLYFFVLS